MCVFAYGADTGDNPSDYTIELGVSKDDPQLGRIHVLGYQNTVQNLHPGANAMILHLPAQGQMDEQNFIDTSTRPGLLTDMVKALQPMPKSMYMMGMRGGPDDGGPTPRVFDYDVYTIVLVPAGWDVQEVLLDAYAGGRVPIQRQVTFPPVLFRWYRAHKPQHTLAVCLFNVTTPTRANPFLVWYVPQDPYTIELPAIDQHQPVAGKTQVPDLAAWVPVNHWILLGSDTMDPSQSRMMIDGTGRAPAELLRFLPGRFTGERFTGTMLNGDFTVSLADLEKGRTAGIVRSR